jgi:hypothetical protein
MSKRTTRTNARALPKSSPTPHPDTEILELTEMIESLDEAEEQLDKVQALYAAADIAYKSLEARREDLVLRLAKLVASTQDGLIAKARTFSDSIMLEGSLERIVNCEPNKEVDRDQIVWASLQRDLVRLAKVYETEDRTS